MTTVACSAVSSLVSRDKAGQECAVVGTLGTSTDGDTITLTLPTRWRGVGIEILSVSCQKWTTGSPATAAGARTKTVQPISLVSYVESTGVVSMLLGTGADIGGTETARVHVQLAKSLT